MTLDLAAHAQGQLDAADSEAAALSAVRFAVSNFVGTALAAPHQSVPIEGITALVFKCAASGLQLPIHRSAGT